MTDPTPASSTIDGVIDQFGSQRRPARGIRGGRAAPRLPSADDRVAGTVARPGSHRTVRTLFVYGSSGQLVVNPGDGPTGNRIADQAYLRALRSGGANSHLYVVGFRTDDRMAFERQSNTESRGRPVGDEHAHMRAPRRQ
ncbi:MAG: hypothetical protein ACLP01_05755 [Solirubrobacteraceae bacterium]